jgi:hypothetical protein
MPGAKTISERDDETLRLSEVLVNGQVRNHDLPGRSTNYPKGYLDWMKYLSNQIV